MLTGVPSETMSTDVRGMILGLVDDDATYCDPYGPYDSDNDELKGKMLSAQSFTNFAERRLDEFQSARDVRVTHRRGNEWDMTICDDDFERAPTIYIGECEFRDRVLFDNTPWSDGDSDTLTELVNRHDSPLYNIFGEIYDFVFGYLNRFIDRHVKYVEYYTVKDTLEGALCQPIAHVVLGYWV